MSGRYILMCFSCSFSIRFPLRSLARTCFFGTLKTELLHRRSWPTRRMAKDAVASYIEGFYNPYRLHSSLDYNSPMVFERSSSP